ncbi:MAG TPA: isochorismatase family cysteine hydrolase [Dongiaceae bacterium]|nr:isochorismatase family cysteine hydrolase [Dongiaceae bacterium]
MDFMDERLRRKLIKRRGRLHVFDRLFAAKTAVIVIDMTQAIYDVMPSGTALIEPINTLTEAARRVGAIVAWIAPLPPSRSRSRTQARVLLGDESMERHEVEASNRAPARGLILADSDWHIDKSSYSAFFPGNSDLPERLAESGIDTVVIAGVLTDVCVASSARDAFESGYRVLVCADGVAANEQLLHAMALRTLARGYADVRSSGELAALLAADAE